MYITTVTFPERRVLSLPCCSQQSQRTAQVAPSATCTRRYEPASCTPR